MKGPRLYEPFLAEIGLFSIVNWVNLKKMKLFYELWNSDNDRVAKRILIQQKDNEKENCWFSEVNCMMNQIEVEIDDVSVMTKNEWSSNVRKKLISQIEGKLSSAGSNHDL